MRWGRILPIMVIVSAGGASAQTPSPALQQSKPQGQAAWPAQPPQQSTWPQQHQAAAPGPPMVAMGAPGGVQPLCFAQFINLRTEVETHGAAAKAASDRHVQRGELCKLVTALSAASNKLTKFTVAKANECGIPADVRSRGWARRN